MVDFAGWSMPVQYSSIVAEHNATRTAVSLFDVSHMGRLRFFGPDAADFLDHAVTRRIADMQPGQVRYALVTNENGGILDDVLVYRGDQGGQDFGMVVNASNREKIVDWLEVHSWRTERQRDSFPSIGDDTLPTAMIAVQGPKALSVLAPLASFHDSAADGLASMKYYTCAVVFVLDYGVMLSRTGYTGEDGFEIICDKDQAKDIWERLIEAAAEVGGMAAGLGARDTLRLEAAMPLYGHELNDKINPLEAGLHFAVNLKDRHFPGSDVLAAVKRDGPRRVRIGLELASKRVPREHYRIFADGRAIGEVTSGTFSPTLQKPIAMGYVPPQYAGIGSELQIDIRGAKEPTRVVKLPFYKRTA
jgi:aminomethyltransferase